jgi:hypothetical protein
VSQPLVGGHSLDNETHIYRAEATEKYEDAN